MIKHQYIFIVPGTQYKKKWEFFPFPESGSKNDVIRVENQAVIDILLYTPTGNTEKTQLNSQPNDYPGAQHLVERSVPTEIGPIV